MPGPYIINDLTLLSSLIGKPAVIPDIDKNYGVQCVGLLKYYSDCGGTKSWTKGDDVSGACDAKTIARGTAVATFNSEGKYASNPTGNHACFFIEEQKDGSGFLVLEQHVDPFPEKIQIRVLKYNGVPKGGKIEMNNGDCYSVIA